MLHLQRDGPCWEIQLLLAEGDSRASVGAAGVFPREANTCALGNCYLLQLKELQKHLTCPSRLVQRGSRGKSLHLGGIPWPARAASWKTAGSPLSWSHAPAGWESSSRSSQYHSTRPCGVEWACSWRIFSGSSPRLLESPRAAGVPGDPAAMGHLPSRGAGGGSQPCSEQAGSKRTGSAPQTELLPTVGCLL